MEMKISNKVKDHYDIDFDLLGDLARREIKGTFYSKSFNFYRDVQFKDVKTLSQTQINWLVSIENSLRKVKNFKKFHTKKKKSRSFWQKIKDLF